jgi:hypothetical protein
VAESTQSLISSQLNIILQCGHFNSFTLAYIIYSFKYDFIQSIQMSCFISLIEKILLESVSSKQI